MKARSSPDERGVIFPQKLPSLARYSPREGCADLVQWFWVPRWLVPVGQIHRQELLPFPAANLTVESSGITITGASTKASHVDLSGEGWALGLLLQPAGLAALGVAPGSIVDTAAEHRNRAVHEYVRRAMDAGEDDTAIDHVSTWLEQLPPPPRRSLEANRLLRAVAQRPHITSTATLARALHSSPRTIQRLAEEFIGLPPLAIIRRYRLQEAAERLREGTATIADIAARLDYFDHAHFTHDFRRTLGYSPREYRESAE